MFSTTVKKIATFGPSQPSTQPFKDSPIREKHHLVSSPNQIDPFSSRDHLHQSAWPTIYSYRTSPKGWCFWMKNKEQRIKSRTVRLAVVNSRINLFWRTTHEHRRKIKVKSSTTNKRFARREREGREREALSTRRSLVPRHTNRNLLRMRQLVAYARQTSSGYHCYNRLD